jgi:xeroderma pigmentosum group C-complementing protein
VLERHLLRDQVISQGAHELGKFRGEPVYSRSQVLQLKAADNWMRHGRVVRAGEQPLKYVKQRAATLNRRRELEIRADAEGADGGNGVMQGLYAERQTERYVPPPVVDVRSSFLHSHDCLIDEALITFGNVGKDPEEQLWEH